jgi:hypothetical protein
MSDIKSISEILERIRMRDDLIRFAKSGAPPISPEPWDEEAERLARAVADLNDDLQRAPYP